MSAAGSTLRRKVTRDEELQNQHHAVMDAHTEAADAAQQLSEARLDFSAHQQRFQDQVEAKDKYYSEMCTALDNERV